MLTTSTPTLLTIFLMTLSAPSASEKRCLENGDDESRSPPKKRRTADKSPSSQPPQSGTYSHQLPLEIRGLGWAFYFAKGRIVAPYAHTIEGKYLRCNYEKPESLFKYKEAFRAAIQDRQWVPVWKDVNLMLEGGGETMYDWIDPKRDSLYIDFSWDIHDGFEEIENTFETVIIDLQDSYYFEVQYLLVWFHLLRSSVKKIQIVYKAYNCNISRSSVKTLHDFLIIDPDEESGRKQLSELQSLDPDSSIWKTLEVDMRKIKERKINLRVQNGTLAGFGKSEENYHIWLATDDKRQYVPLPKGTEVTCKGMLLEFPEFFEEFFEPYLIEMLWADCATFLGQLRRRYLGSEETTTFRSVVRINLQQ